MEHVEGAVTGAELCRLAGGERQAHVLPFEVMGVSRPGALRLPVQRRVRIGGDVQRRKMPAACWLVRVVWFMR
jgi:hypothetical protein